MIAIHKSNKKTLLSSKALLIFGLIAIFFLVGCGQAEEAETQSIPTIVVEVLTAVAPTAEPEPTATLPAPTQSQPQPTLTQEPDPTVPQPTETSPPPPTAAAASGADLAINSQKLFVYPSGEIFAGDPVTIQFVVDIPDTIDPDTVEVLISLNGQPLNQSSGFQMRNLGGDVVGLHPWIWDTTNAPGTYAISVTLDPNDRISSGDENPNNNTAVQDVTVLPRSAMDTREVAADWITTESEMAFIHVVAGTAAERDITYLTELTDQAIRTAAIRLQEEPARKYDVFFIDRVIGQGGYATGSMVVSYLDRNYAGGGIAEVLTHEAIHLLDQQFIQGDRPAFLAEAVAVWATGGHYKQENLNERVRALRDTGLAYDLVPLIDNFYPVQHEIGYLQAGAFFNFLVERYGWEQVKLFYANIPTDAYQTPSARIDAALQANFGQSLSQLEAEWIRSLGQQSAAPVEISDLNSTLHFYNVMRDYQLAYDPTAHFEQAWLPSPRQLLERDLTAELSRKPGEVTNIALEIMLTEADNALQANNFQKSELLINTVERVIINDGLFVDPLAQSYRDIVATSLDWGFEPHRITIEGNTATVLVTNPFSAQLFPIDFFQNGPIWVLVQETE
ncbi:MAG: hypothetical protein QNJ45_05470 [Ardenticatenaceae bacterium]|nr:hypothetical protein [Ardenticatenaceae bacterium]